MKRKATPSLALLALLLTLFNTNISAQSTVVLAGSFQDEAGCTGDWMPDCNFTHMTQTKPYTWELAISLPAGNFEFKVTYNNSWTENYGAGGIQNGPNIPLSLGATTMINFIYNATTHLVEITFINPPGVPFAVTLAGSFQSELGCPGDWQPECGNSGLNYDLDSNLWYTIFALPQGDYEYKVTIDQSWNENYGMGGVPNGANIPLNVSSDKKILFRYSHETHLVTTNLVNYSVILAGSFQSELGCPADWMANCPATGLNFDPVLNLWKREFNLPAGNWEFKVTLDDSWTENYGAGGVPNGPNFVLNLPVPSKVFFSFNPETHQLYSSVSGETVVLAGSFQSELGCTGDWNPACDLTRLSYDPIGQVWKGNLDVPAGNWEFKVTMNNSWDINYGLFGIPGGPNIPLNLDIPASINFSFHPLTHLVSLVYNTTGICVNAFYDANTNGYQDFDEYMPMAGVEFKLSVGGNAVLTTGMDGKACFAPLNPGVYTVNETVPVGYLPSSPDSQSVGLTAPQTLQFGLVCLGGAGARNLAFWITKNGKAAFDALANWQKDYILNTLRFYNLCNTDGSDFDPNSYADLANWMQGANAKNKAYKLSAQMAALYLNAEVFQLGNRMIYTPGISYWGWQKDFMFVNTVVLYINQQLFTPTALGGDPIRADFEYLSNMLLQANSNLSFVQLQPCGISPLTMKPNLVDLEQELTTLPRIWPNPTGDYFNLRPASGVPDGKVQIRIFDALGKAIFSTTGSALKDYRFGENFLPGLYMVEISQGGKRTVVKLVKQ
jgi:hypothetical protein